MSTLTKIAVVLLFVVAVAAAAFVIPWINIQADYKAAYEQQVLARKNAEAQAQANAQQSATWQGLYNALREEGSDTQRELQTALKTAKDEVEDKNRTIAQLTGRLDVLAASSTAQEKNLAALNDQLKQTTAALDKERTDKIQLQDQLRDTAREIQKLSNDLEAAQAEVRVRLERIAQLEGEVRDLNERLVSSQRSGLAGAATPAAPSPAAKISGSVTAVQDSIIGLNVGAADGVKADMVFYVYRGPNFVAHARISEVQPSSSAAVVVDARRPVQQGDSASTSLE